MNKLRLLKCLLIGIVLLQLWSCKKDQAQPDAQPPTVTFNTATGEYKAKVGTTLAIVATVSDATHPVYSWKLNGKIISTDLACTFNAEETGEYFLTFRVDAENGSAEQQVKVSVLDKLPPQIKLSSTVIVYAGLTAKISPNALYTDKDTKYTWKINGVTVSTDSVYTFTTTTLGTNKLTIKVANADGEDFKSVDLTVLPAPVAELFFDDGHYHIPGDKTVKRLSVPLGRSIVLAPVISNTSGALSFSWTVDGVAQSSNKEYLTFQPTTKGSYLISVTAQNITAQVKVECVDAEGTFFRSAQTGSKAMVTKAFDFIPAPGQFVNFSTSSTAAQATQQIQTSLDNGQGATGYIALLGAYGGYFVTGFDHSVNNVEGKADLSISGNAFAGWSEPGIVWVMQDENGNGLPDDTWYELKGSETGKPGTKQRYAVTYYRPTAINSNVLWTDNLGGTGSVDYNGYHTQQYYFPMFIKEASYTLTGTRLASTFANGTIDTNDGYAWGYVDNLGDGSKLNFWLEDAVKADGSAANLKYIDFVKVHTGSLGKGVAVGEISTESGAPVDLNHK